MLGASVPPGPGRPANASIFQWDNVPKALVTGLEGTFNYNFTPRVAWTNNLTYMIKSENKSTGEQLSIIPKYTVNSRLEWKVTDEASVFGTATFYGRQKANKLDYQGLPVQGEEAQGLSPYALVGLGGNYAVSRNLKVGLGVDNIFDKRLFRRGQVAPIGIVVALLDELLVSLRPELYAAQRAEQRGHNDSFDVHVLS